MARIYNFSAGPSMLPLAALESAQLNLTEYETTGQSVMEMSHRSSEYAAIIEDTERRFREVLAIPDDYSVLFLQGGASLQFSMVPMNLMTVNRKADYAVTGQWAQKAYEEGKRFGECRCVGSSADATFSYIPELAPVDPEADYLHICYNNTIFGSAFQAPPETGSVPLVADMSSCILGFPIDVSKFGVIYAGAQKNMGPAGLCVNIIRKDLLARTPDTVPTMLDYRTHDKNGSMFNTPPTFAIYMLGLVLKWLQEDIGGLEKMAEINCRKAKALYNCIDESNLFNCPVRADSRSLMNVTFVTGDKDLDKKFIAEAKEAGFINIAGHRSVGGMRASIYNAMPEEGVYELIEFMRRFEHSNG